MFLAGGAIMAMILLVLIFWLVMFVDCCGRKFDRGIERLVWLLVILLSHVLGSFIYYILITKHHPTGLLDKEGHLR